MRHRAGYDNDTSNETIDLVLITDYNFNKQHYI